MNNQNEKITQELTEQELTEQELRFKQAHTKLHKYTIEATETDIMVMDLLFGTNVEDNLRRIEQENPTDDHSERNQYICNGLFGASHGILRSALLMKTVAPSKPEIYKSLMKIAGAISIVGEKLLKDEIDDTNGEPSFIESSLDDKEYQDILDILSGIDVELPDDLQ